MNVMQERDTTTIRQTVTFNASPQEVYEVIMDSKKHESLSGEKANISGEVGGAFKAWGDHISGFNLVLHPSQKIVQAWRAHDWWADHYSIATFDLRKVGGGTELCFTQIGVPPTDSTATLGDGSKPIGNQCRNSSTKALLATKREQQVQQPGNELIKESSETGILGRSFLVRSRSLHRRLPAAVREDSSHKAAREVLARANSDPAAILAAIGEPARAGVTPLYSPTRCRRPRPAASVRACDGVSIA